MCFWSLSVICCSEDFHTREVAATCHVLGRHTGKPFTSAVLRWVPISPVSNPHYCLSISCRHVKRTQRWSHSVKCFSHFCSTSFHLSSLTPWQRLISEDWRSLWLSDSVCHRIASLLRWSNRNLGNLMLQLSELFPRGKLNDFRSKGWLENRDASMDGKKHFEYRFTF